MNIVSGIINSTKMTDFNLAVSKGMYAGYVSIFYRKSGNPSNDINRSLHYAMNSHNDTWFRGFEGNGKGYGLPIQKIKVTSNNPVSWKTFDLYKVVIEFIPVNSDDPNDRETDKFWLMVHRDFEVKDVLKYIEANKNKWVP